MEPTRIHAGKTPYRLHFIVEWAEKRGMKQKDIVRETGIDKSTVSRWYSGSVPKDEHLDVLSALFHTDVHGLFRHPDDDWLAKLFRNKPDEQRERAIKMLELFLESEQTTGTDG